MSTIPYVTERKSLANHILLDANEHYEQWVKVPISGVSNLNRYPDQECTKLREKLATIYCKPLKSSNILITAGSIEAIDLLMYAIRPRRLIINTPSYDVYLSRASIHGVTTISVPLQDDGQPNVNTILSENHPDDILVLINPNNPTGDLVQPLVVNELLKSFKGTIVVDEAYIEYAGLDKSFQHLVGKTPNLIILRTFSKAWGLAGARLGYVLSSPEIIEQLHRHKNFYSVSTLAIAAGVSALNQVEELPKHVENVLKAKQHMLDNLRRRGFVAEDTDANFILINIDNPLLATSKLRSRGIVVRPRPGIRGNNHLRVTVGSKNENLQLIMALEGLADE